MTMETYSTPAFVDVPASVELDVQEPQAVSWEGEALLAGMIWGPSLAIAAVLYLTKVYYPAAITLGLGMVLHAFLRPRAAVYVFILLVYVDWMVELSVFFSVGKLFGVLAVLVSLPKILGAVGGRIDPSVKWILPFMLLPLLLVPVAQYPAWSLVWCPTIVLVYGLPLLLCVNLVSMSHVRMLALLLVLGGLINSVVYISRGDIGVLAEVGEERMFVGSDIGMDVSDSNELARLISVGIFASIFLFVTSRKLWIRVLAGALGVVLAFGVVIIKARACYAGVPGSLVISLLLLKGAGLSRRLVLVLVVLLMATAALVIGDVVGFWGAGIQERITSITEQGAQAGRRSLLWAGYFKAFLASGMVGNGLRMTQFSPAFLDVAGGPMAAHNDFLHVAGDLGIFGLILFTGLHVHLFRRIRRMSLTWHKMFALNVWVFILLAALTQSDFWRRYYGLSLGVVFVLIRFDERRREAALAAQAQTPAYD